MKIIFLIPSLAKGGQEKAGMILCNFLSKHHKVTAICFENRNEGDFNYRCDIIRIISPSGSTLTGKFISGIKRLKRLRYYKRQIKPDITIAFGNTAIILNSLTSVGEKKIASIRQSFKSLLITNSPVIKIHTSLYRWSLRQSEKIVPVSNAINQELYKYFGIDNDTYINNGYDFEEIQRLSSEPVFFSSFGHIRLIHMGRMDLSKGHWHMIKIFVNLKKSWPTLQLVLIGGTDTSGLGKQIEEYCKTYLQKYQLTWSSDESIDADVLFLGHQTNPFKYLSNADLFLFPSIWEGFPNSLLEAMACGLPVMAADCPTGPSEILLNKESNEEFGVLMPAFNDTFKEEELDATEADMAWVKVISDLLQNPGKLIFLKSQALKRSKKYSIEEMGKQWLNIIES